MKIEFRPDFHIDLKLEILWPKLKGAFKGLTLFRGIRFERGDYPRLLGRALLILSAVAAIIAAIVLLLRILA